MLQSTYKNCAVHTRPPPLKQIDPASSVSLLSDSIAIHTQHFEHTRALSLVQDRAQIPIAADAGRKYTARA